MIGFSFKNLMLQIIHGSIVLLAIIYLYWNFFYNHVPDIKNLESLALLLFLIASFSVGVIIDFIADVLESFIMKSPIYHLLTKERWMGITLAHNSYILDELCRIASAYYRPNKNQLESTINYKKSFEARNKKIINYILQVAKNKAFRECKDYQKDQIDSFFILYIFSRNLALSLFISSLFFLRSEIALSLALIGAVVLALSSSYRYYLYYCRILLGSTIDFSFKK